jgi:Zn-dependent protease
MFWIAFAGPLSNLILALIGTILIWLVATFLANAEITKTAVEFLKAFIIINLFLAFFNLIPLHPLDGGKVIARFLPDRLNNKLEENQHMLSMVLLVVFVAGGFSFLAGPVYWTYEQLLTIVRHLVI